MDWSRTSVETMKNAQRGRFQNASYYFSKGISFSDTGIYSPTFRLSHGGVFDQKGSCIFCEFFSREFLLGVLCSKLIKYFVKAFINSSVSSQVESIKGIPLAIPSSTQQSGTESLVKKIVTKQITDGSYDYVEEQTLLDQMVYRLYDLKDEEILEVENWYDRRYPKLRRDVDTEALEEG